MAEHQRQHTAESGDFTVTSEWTTHRGRLEPIAITVAHRDRLPISSATIRTLPLGEIIEESRRSLVGRPPPRAIRRDAGPQRGQRIAPEVLNDLAHIYQEAYSRGEPVCAAVAEHFQIARSTAAKRIMKARAAGLLTGVGHTWSRDP